MSARQTHREYARHVRGEVRSALEANQRRCARGHGRSSDHVTVGETLVSMGIGGVCSFGLRDGPSNGVAALGTREHGEPGTSKLVTVPRRPLGRHADRDTIRDGSVVDDGEAIRDGVEQIASGLWQGVLSVVR